MRDWRSHMLDAAVMALISLAMFLGALGALGRAVAAMLQRSGRW